MCTNKTKHIWQDREHDLLPSTAWEALLNTLNLSSVWTRCEFSPLRAKQG